MGIVRMTEEITKEWEDLNGIHPCATAALYIYCDKCGSFSIKSQIENKKIILIIVAFLFTAAGIFAAFQQRHGIYWLCLCLVICIFAFRYLWGDISDLCKKCGSVPTTSYNTLGYPSDIGILDVPDQFAQKRYKDYFPEWYNLDNALMSQEGQIKKDDVVSLISHDVNQIPKFLLFILSPILLIIFTIIYPIFLIFYLIWNVHSSKREHD